jgi:hypothetical protein
MRQIDKFILHVVHSWANPINEAYSEPTIKRFIEKFKQEADDFDIKISDDQLRKYIERFDQMKEKFSSDERDLDKYSLSKLIQVASTTRSAEIPEKEDDTPDVVYNDNGITIWNGAKRDNCIHYGRGERWCITQPSGQYYSNYRFGSDYKYPTFYLAKNDNLSDSDKLSFVALQVLDNGQYKFTNRENSPGMEGPFSWEELNRRVPWLQEIPNLKNTLKYIPLSNTEKLTQKYKKEPISIKEWSKFPYSVKEQYLVVRKQEELFSDVSNNEFIQKYIPKYPELAEFIAKNPDIVDPVILLKNLESFSPNDRKSITANLREKIDSKLLSLDTLPFDVKKLLVKLDKWSYPSNERLYLTKDGNVIVKLTLGDDIKVGLYTKDDNYPNIKLNQRTSKYLLDYSELDKIPFRNLIKLVEDNIISKELLDKVLEQAKDNPNSAIIIKDTDQGQILIDSNSFTAYELLPNGRVISVPFDNEEVIKALEDEKDNESLQNNALQFFKSFDDIPDNIDEKGLKSLINNIPYDKRILNMNDAANITEPLVLIPSDDNYSFAYMSANPNDSERRLSIIPLSYGRNNDWRTRNGGPRDGNKPIFEKYFAYLRNENKTLNDESLLKVFKGYGYTSDQERNIKTAFVEANPPTSPENRYFVTMYNDTPLLINKANPKESFKVSNTGKMTKANVSNALARQLLGTNAPEAPAAAAAAAPAAGERRRGRPAGGAAQPRPQGQAGDVNVAERMRETGLGNGFTRLPRNDFNRLNIDNARRVPAVNDRGASRRNNLLGNAGQVGSAIVTPGGSSIYFIRLANQDIVASVVIQPGNRHYLITPTAAVSLNSPTELLRALQQRDLAENLRKFATKLYLAENPHMLDETVGMIKKLKEIKITPSILDRYESVKVMSEPYIKLNISFLENYIDRFLEEPYEYEQDMNDFILQDSVELNTNTITFPNFINYLTDDNFKNWFNNDFSEIKYILSLKDVSSINDYVNKKAKELSKDNPEDFNFYQTEIKDIVLKLKEQVPLFLKTVELLKGKYTTISTFLDYFNSAYSVLLYNIGNNIGYIAVDKNLGFFDDKGNIQIKQKIYDKLYREYDTELDEIKITPSVQLNIGKPKTVTRRYIKDNSDYFQYNYFYDLVDLGKYYTLIPSGNEDQPFLLISKEMFDDNFDGDLTGSDNKLDFLYPPIELSQIYIEALKDKIKQKPEFISEIKINPSTINNAKFFSKNSRHPDLYNFVKQYLPKIFNAVKSDNPDNDKWEYYFEEEIEEGDESFNYVENYEVRDDNFWLYLDEKGKYPYGQDISVDFKNEEYKGFYITNMSPEQHSEFDNEFNNDVYPLPGFPGLYYEYIYI